MFKFLCLVNTPLEVAHITVFLSQKITKHFQSESLAAMAYYQGYTECCQTSK